jgi:fatty-acyl-CoA synthase
VADDTLIALLERAAGSNRGVRFVDRAERAYFFSYAELYERAIRTAEALRLAGLGPGDRVAMVLPTAPGFYDAFFGTLLAGCVPAPLYPPVRLGRLDEYHRRTASLLRGCGARMVLTDARIRRVLGRSVASAAPDLGCLTLGQLSQADGSAGAGGGSGSPLGQADVSLARAQPRPEDIAFIQHSSGTTGHPRPICLTHGAVVANVRAIQARILASYPEDGEEPHTAVGWLPLYHDMGLIGCVITSLAHPVDLTLIPPELFVSRPAIWLRTISRYRATVSPAPNFAFGLCADRVRDDELSGVDLSCWRVALNGAEPVTPAALRRFIDRFAPFGLRESALTPVYGLAEATLAVTFSDPLEPVRTETFHRERLARDGRAVPAEDGLALVSVGQPLPGVDVRIVGDGADAVPGRRAEGEGALGRVQIRGPSLMRGYHRLPRETEAAVHGGWLDTGDTGFVHGGHLFLYGRGKDVIVLRGCKYSPEQVEHALDGLVGARPGCAAAIGTVPEGADAEELTVLLERVRQGNAADDEALASRARRMIVERTGLVPARVGVLEPGTLPRTSSGKIRRAEARRLFLAGQLRSPARVNRLTLLREMVRSRLELARIVTSGSPAHRGARG